jgi:hypothetical protein
MNAMIEDLVKELLPTHLAIGRAVHPVREKNMIELLGLYIVLWIYASSYFLISDYPEYRGRPVSPRYADYGRVGAEPTGRYRFERSFVFL